MLVTATGRPGGPRLCGRCARTASASSGDRHRHQRALGGRFLCDAFHVVPRGDDPTSSRRRSPSSPSARASTSCFPQSSSCEVRRARRGAGALRDAAAGRRRRGDRAPATTSPRRRWPAERAPACRSPRRIWRGRPSEFRAARRGARLPRARRLHEAADTPRARAASASSRPPSTAGTRCSRRARARCRCRSTRRSRRSATATSRRCS